MDVETLATVELLQYNSNQSKVSRNLETFPYSTNKTLNSSTQCPASYIITIIIILNEIISVILYNTDTAKGKANRVYCGMRGEEKLYTVV